MNKLPLFLWQDQLKIQALTVTFHCMFHTNLSDIQTEEKHIITEMSQTENREKDNWEMHRLSLNYPYRGQQTWHFKNSSWKMSLFYFGHYSFRPYWRFLKADYRQLQSFLYEKLDSKNQGFWGSGPTLNRNH